MGSTSGEKRASVATSLYMRRFRAMAAHRHTSRKATASRCWDSMPRQLAGHSSARSNSWLTPLALHNQLELKTTTLHETWRPYLHNIPAERLRAVRELCFMTLEWQMCGLYVCVMTFECLSTQMPSAALHSPHSPCTCKTISTFSSSNFLAQSMVSALHELLDPVKLMMIVIHTKPGVMQSVCHIQDSNERCGMLQRQRDTPGMLFSRCQGQYIYGEPQVMSTWL